MRVLKVVIGIAVALVLVVVLGAVAILFFVDPNAYRGQIESRVEAATGRPLHLNGKLGLKVFPRIAVEVNDSSLGNPPAYGAQPFLTVQQARLGLKLWPLLHKRFELARISLDGLTVNLVSRSAQDNNWKDFGKSSSQKEDEPASASNASFTVAGVDISRSTLVYRDEEQKKTTRLSGLQLHTGAVGGAAPVDTHLELDYDEGGPKVAHITLKARLGMPSESQRVEVADLSVDGQWFGAPAAKPTSFSLTSSRLKLDTRAETLEPSELKVKWGNLPIDVSVAGEKLFTHRVVTGKLSIAPLSPRDLMPALGVTPPVTRDSKVMNRFSMTTGYRMTENALELSKLDLKLDDTHVQGSLGIDDLKSMALSFDLAVDAINVDRYRAPEPPKSEGPSSAAQSKSVPTPLPIAALRKLDLQGKLRLGKATVADLAFENVRTAVAAHGGRVHLGPTQAGLFGGSYNGDLTLDASGPKARLSLNEHTRDIDIGKLVKASFKSDRMSGRGDADAMLTGIGNTDAAILSSLAGHLGVNLKDSAFNGVDLWFELRRAMALVKGLPLPSAAVPARTVFKVFSGTATLSEGILANEDLRFDMDYLKARGRGTLAMSSQAVDYHLVAEIYKLPPQGAGSELSDLKALEIPVSITGTLSALKVRPDIQDLLKARLRKEVDKQIDKHKEELKQKLGDKLKDLFGR